MRTKGRRWLLGVVWLVIMLASPLLALGYTFDFQEVKGITVEILTQDEFDTTIGKNPDVPRTDAAVVEMARKLFPPIGKKELIEQTDVDSREYEVGVLFAALKNPSLNQSTLSAVDSVMAAAIPPLPKTYTSGHFKFYYTDNNADPNNNVTLAQVKDTAIAINAAWNTYAANFKEPKYYLSGTTKMVDVKVYYLGATLYGETASSWNYINLNSKLTVQNTCKRRTTSAHELFHRVQYAYGYVSGTANMKWIVEGTASWSQKFTYSWVRDYMSRMNTGLSSPNLNLITERSYDAAHFWVYLHEQAGATAIKQVWAKYQVNGKKAKEAVGSVTTALLGLNFDDYSGRWSRTNYVKDLTNAITGGYDYDENAVTTTSCGVVYGPLTKVPVTTGTINSSSNYTQSSTVKPYGAKYHVFTLNSTLKNLAVNFKGTGSFQVNFIGIKSNAWKSIIKTNALNYDYKRTLTAGQWDKLAVVVMGTTTGGSYSLKIGSCVAGTWTDSFAKTWVLKESGTTITGTRDATPVGCGLTNVTGTYNAPNITLNTNIVVSGCCSVRWAGTVTACNSITGTWTQTGGATGCTGTGSFSMTKNPGSSIFDAIINSSNDPTCTNNNSVSSVPEAAIESSKDPTTCTLCGEK